MTKEGRLGSIVDDDDDDDDDDEIRGFFSRTELTTSM